jgi:broad specificity phosphatase PhoE
VFVEQVYSSDLPRAKRTAEIINEILTQRFSTEPVREISLLRERSFGIFEGKTREQVMKEFPEQYTAFQKFDLVFIL